MELRHLQTLVVLAQERHFGRAARRLHVVQSAVTRTIQALEHEVGVALFERDRHGVRLTAAGEVLLQRAHQILGAVEGANREAREVGAGRLTRLRIAMSGLSGAGCLPEALEAFRRRHPAVSIELVPLSSAEQVAALRRGEIELALSNMPLADDSLALEMLYQQPLFAILPAAHRLSRRKAVSWNSLEGEVHIVLARAIEPEVFRAFTAISRSQGQPWPTVVEVEDVSLMLVLVAAGLGISHLPQDATRIQFAGVVARPIEPSVQIGLFAAFAPGAHAPLVGELLAELRRHERSLGKLAGGKRAPDRVR
jgi:DNA-binding transcriptional LysR family regulator